MKPINHVKQQDHIAQTPPEELPCLDKVKETCNLYYPQILAHHAPRPAILTCSTVGCIRRVDSYYMCQDCFYSQWYCKDCIVQIHEDNPLHYIKTWDVQAQCMVSARLRDLGLVVKLIHENGQSCASRGTLRELKVMHTTGMHEIVYWQCLCYQRQSNLSARPAQLLANRLFPASETSPRTAFTFDVLRSFDSLNLQGSINFKQFCDSIFFATPEGFRLDKEVRAAHWQ